MPAPAPTPDQLAALLAAARRILAFDEAGTLNDRGTPESGDWQSLELSDAFDALRAALEPFPPTG